MTAAAGRWVRTQRVWWDTVLGRSPPPAGRARFGLRLLDAQRELVTGLLATACGAGEPGRDVQAVGRRRQRLLHEAAARLVDAQAAGWADAWARAVEDGPPPDP